MAETNTKPLFMWAGGKTKVLKFYEEHMPESVKEYSEPFFGGGAMYLHVQQRYKPERCFISDTNEGITNLYRSVKEDLEPFVETLKKLEAKYIPMSKEDRKKFYYETRRKHAYEYEGWGKTKEAAVLYFLMKTGFNGIWQINNNTNGRFGTPSGLLNQKTAVFDYDNIKSWNRLLQNTEIVCGDWTLCPSGDFNFIDPPYRSSFTSYGTEWNDESLEALIEATRSKPGTSFICNRCDGTDWLERRSEGYQMIKFPIKYTAGRRKKTEDGYEAKEATEVLMIKK